MYRHLATLSRMSDRSVSAATVTLDAMGRVLLIRRADTGEWQIPGGVVEHGEQPTDTAVRETVEESGITPEALRLTGVYTNVARDITAFVFIAQARAGKVSVSDESVDVGFFEPQAAISMVPDVFSRRITDALESASVTFRAHDGKVWL